jgi:hypothetical protein
MDQKKSMKEEILDAAFAAAPNDLTIGKTAVIMLLRA